MAPGRKSNYFILTGTPGTGKTSVLQHLAASGFHVNCEPARQVLTEQLDIDGPALPAKSPLLFIQEMLRRSIEFYERSRKLDGLVFFDRGIPDLVAYAARFGVDPGEFVHATNEYPYNSTVFIFPPWKDIFVNDSARKLTFEMSQEFHKILVRTYAKPNFNLIEMPLGSVESRAEFIVQICSHSSGENSEKQ